MDYDKRINYALQCNTWYKITCPNCNVSNWIRGEVDEEEIPDIDYIICQCFDCKYKFWLNEFMYNLSVDSGIEMEDSWTKWGLEFPEDTNIF